MEEVVKGMVIKEEKEEGNKITWEWRGRDKLVIVGWRQWEQSGWKSEVVGWDCGGCGGVVVEKEKSLGGMKSKKMTWKYLKNPTLHYLFDLSF